MLNNTFTNSSEAYNSGFEAAKKVPIEDLSEALEWTSGYLSALGKRLYVKKLLDLTAVGETKEEKSLAQIGYEASESGGKQNFGEWENAPAIVREVHKDIAAAIKKAVLSGDYCG